LDGLDIAVHCRYEDDGVSENGSSSESGDGPDDGETSGLSSIPGTDPPNKSSDRHIVIDITIFYFGFEAQKFIETIFKESAPAVRRTHFVSTTKTNKLIQFRELYELVLSDMLRMSKEVVKA
jgi:hypothetical protein